MSPLGQNAVGVPDFNNLELELIIDSLVLGVAGRLIFAPETTKQS